MLVSVSLDDVHSKVVGKVEGITHTFVNGGVCVRPFIAVAVDVHTITRVLVFNEGKWAWRRLGREVE